MTQKCFDIPIIFESLAIDIACGKITIEKAAYELNRCNYTPYVDIERAQKILAPYIARIKAEKGDVQ